MKTPPLFEDGRVTPEKAKAKILQALESGGPCFQCCFCHEGIDGDVHALILVTKWDGPEDKQKSQQWFCHAECFMKATGEHIDVLEEGA